jgi:hypothetical protein
MILKKTLLLLIVLFVGFVCIVCGNPKNECDYKELDISVCDPSNGPFSTTVDNEYFPLSDNRQWILEGDEDGVTVRVVRDDLATTKVVAGVTTRVVRETETEDGELIEISWNYFAQAPDGTVCYFGEDVDIYEDGAVVSHDGAWLAGENGYRPGIIMPGNPLVGTKFYQEYAPGVAMDMSAVVGLNKTYTVPFGTYTNVLEANDWNPIEEMNSLGGDWFACQEGELKAYERNLGLIIDEFMELISYTP